MSVKYVPEWMPGAGFKKIAKKWRKLQESVRHGAYDMVVEQQVRESSVREWRVTKSMSHFRLRDP